MGHGGVISARVVSGGRRPLWLQLLTFHSPMTVPGSPGSAIASTSQLSLASPRDVAPPGGGTSCVVLPSGESDGHSPKGSGTCALDMAGPRQGLQGRWGTLKTPHASPDSPPGQELPDLVPSSPASMPLSTALEYTAAAGICLPGFQGSRQHWHLTHGPAFGKKRKPGRGAKEGTFCSFSFLFVFLDLEFSEE